MLNKIYILIAFLVTTLSQAHVCHKQKAKCPVDGTVVEFCLFMEETHHGYFADLQKQDDHVGNRYQEEIKSCPTCHFSGFLFDFEVHYTDVEKTKLKSHLKNIKEKKIGPAKQCQIAAEIKALLNLNYDQIANCYLVGTYILKYDTNQDKYRKHLQKMAIKYLVKAIKSNEYSDQTEIASKNYLVGEMYRRTGQFKKAISYYDLAINNPSKSKWIADMAVIQKNMALDEDDYNKI